MLVDCLMFSLCFEIQMDMSCLLLYFVILFDAVACMVCFPAVSLFGLMYIAWFSDPIQVTEEERESKCWWINQARKDGCFFQKVGEYQLTYFSATSCLISKFFTSICSGGAAASNGSKGASTKSSQKAKDGNKSKGSKANSKSEDKVSRKSKDGTPKSGSSKSIVAAKKMSNKLKNTDTSKTIDCYVNRLLKQNQ